MIWECDFFREDAKSPKGYYIDKRHDENNGGVRKGSTERGYKFVEYILVQNGYRSWNMLRTEASEQEAVITICKFMENRYPELKLLHHCPNGGKRDRVSAAVLKRQGVKAGVPDLHLPVPKGQYASLYIEMKYGDGRLQKEQKEFLKQAADYGNFVAVCYSQEIALKVIEDYVTLKTGEIMPIENNQVLKRWEEKKWQK